MSREMCPENDRELQGLRSLLHQIPHFTKTEGEWGIIENNLMEKLHAPEPERILPWYSKTINAIARLFILEPQPVIIFSSLFLLFLCSFGVYQYISHKGFFQDKPITAQVIGIQGTLIQKNAKTGALLFEQTQNQQIKAEKVANIPLFAPNRTFVTSDTGLAIINFGEGNTIELSGATEYTIKEAYHGNAAIQLRRGTVLVSIQKRTPAQHFSVLTNNAEISVVGTLFGVTVDQTAKVTSLTVYEGAVKIKNLFSHQTDTIYPGNSAKISPAGEELHKSIQDHKITDYLLSLLRESSKNSALSTYQKGLLSVTSGEDSAIIIIDGKPVGVTPLVISLPEGNHTVTARSKAGGSWSQRVAITPLQVTFVDATLAPITQVTRFSDLAIQQFKHDPAKKIETAIPSIPSEIEPLLGKDSSTKIVKTKDFGFILNPSFVEALYLMTIDEYQKALKILDSLKELPEISITEKIRIMSKITACYRGLGNFKPTLDKLTESYSSTPDSLERGNILWEMINVQANCLGDYESAERNILIYITKYRQGPWILNAYDKLGEVQYLQGKYTKAVGTYQYLIKSFRTNPLYVQKAMYTIANILRLDLKAYQTAIEWYTKLLSQFPTGSYTGNALFERAECYEKNRDYSNAKNDYSTYLERFPNDHLKNLCESKLLSLK